MDETQDLIRFAWLLDALEPWLDQVVIIGGWAHRLYRLHPSAQTPGHAPLMTLDADVVVPAHLSVQGEDIRTRLLARGFKEEFLGDDRPPATHYRVSRAAGSFYAEFLTPLVGGTQDRKGRPKATAEIAGITAQRLRHLELLLRAPWTVMFDAGGFSSRLQVANPIAFLVQKVLIHSKRKPEDRAKDILYAYDTLDLFGSRLADLRDAWATQVRPRLSRRGVAEVEGASKRVFGRVSDDIRRAALIPADRELTPDAVAEACRLGFDEIFESSAPTPDALAR